MAPLTLSTTDVVKDLNQLERQAVSWPAKLGYRMLGGVYEFGQNIVDQFEGEPFRAIKNDLDRLVKQSNSTPAKLGMGAIGAFYGVGSTAFRLPTDVAHGVVAFLTDTIATIKLIPASAMYNSQEIISGAGDIWNGRISRGSARITTGVCGDWLLFEGARMAVKSVPAAYSAYATGANKLLSRRSTSFGADPFDSAVRRNPEFGGVRMGGAPSYAEIGAPIVQQLQRLGDVKDGIFPAPHNSAKMIREIEVMQEIGTQRYHFYVGIDFEGVGPSFELSLARLYYKSADAPMGNALDAIPVSMHRATAPAKTYAQLGFTAQEFSTMPVNEALGVVHSLAPGLATMLNKVIKLVLSDVN